MTYKLSELENIKLQTIEEDGKRFYLSPDGKIKYPSVTTVTGLLSHEQIKLWRQRVGEEKANKISSGAARRGTSFHYVCEDFLRNKDSYIETETLPDFKNIFEEQMFKSLFAFLSGIEPVALEAPLYSELLEMAGRVDCVGMVENKLCIIDFKTSSKPKKPEHVENWMIQTTAYSTMVEELTDETVEYIVAAVAVEDAPSQIFIDRPENYIDDLLSLRQRYRNLYGV